MYFDTDTPNGSSKDFQRHAYQLLGQSQLTLVHYLGNEAVAVNFPYRGSKLERPFQRTAPSTLNRLREVKQSTPGIVYMPQ